MRNAIPKARIENDLRFIEGGAQDFGMADLATQAAPDAAVVYMGDRIDLERIWIRLDCQRWTT
jgi:hypothetical protein